MLKQMPLWQVFCATLPVLRQLLVCWGFWGIVEVFGWGWVFWWLQNPLFGLLKPIWTYLGDKTHPFVLHQEMLALLGPFGPYWGSAGGKLPSFGRLEIRETSSWRCVAPPGVYIKNPPHRRTAIHLIFLGFSGFSVKKGIKISAQKWSKNGPKWSKKKRFFGVKKLPKNGPKMVPKWPKK